MSKRILIVDDDKNMCEMLKFDLKRRGFEPICYDSADKAFTEIKTKEFDVLLTDLNLPGMNGIELCERVVANMPDIPVIVITAFGSLDSAVAAMRVGAYDFVTKPIDLDILVLSLERAIKHRSLQEKVKILSKEVEQYQTTGDLIGASTTMRELFQKISRVADVKSSILITGESGTGKELVAKALHNQSSQKREPFVAINCAALPDTLLESELFGHKRGAFTDAKTERKGLFLEAKGGTLFLDEVGEMSISLQPKLLRALEEHSVRPIGGHQELKFDARIISATNRDLESAVEEGLFREDLFYRLNVIPLEIPPLCDREGDILLLANHFVKQFATRLGKNVDGISNTAVEKLLNYKWPGNIRELRNIIERAVALTQYEKIAVEDLPQKIQDYHSSHVLLKGDNPSELLTMEEVERRYITHVLNTVGDNKSIASRILGIDRKTLYRKIQSYKKNKS